MFVAQNSAGGAAGRIMPARLAALTMLVRRNPRAFPMGAADIPASASRRTSALSIRRFCLIRIPSKLDLHCVVYSRLGNAEYAPGAQHLLSGVLTGSDPKIGSSERRGRGLLGSWASAAIGIEPGLDLAFVVSVFRKCLGATFAADLAGAIDIRQPIRPSGIGVGVHAAIFCSARRRSLMLSSSLLTSRGVASRDPARLAVSMASQASQRASP